MYIYVCVYVCICICINIKYKGSVLRSGLRQSQLLSLFCGKLFAGACRRLTSEPSAHGRKAQHQEPIHIFRHLAHGSRAVPFLTSYHLTLDRLHLRTLVKTQSLRREDAMFPKESGQGLAGFLPLSSAWGHSHCGFCECFAALSNGALGQQSCDSLPREVEKVPLHVVQMGENSRDLPVICTNETVLSSSPDAPAFFSEVTGGTESASHNHTEEVEAMPRNQNWKAGQGDSQLPLLK